MIMTITMLIAAAHAQNLCAFIVSSNSFDWRFQSMASAAEACLMSAIILHSPGNCKSYFLNFELFYLEILGFLWYYVLGETNSAILYKEEFHAV